MGGHLVYRSGTILAILVGSHLGNILMKFVHRSKTVLAVLVLGHLSNIPMKFK